MITGTGGSMGRATALAFAREGASVVGCDVTVERAESTVEMVRGAGIRAQRKAVRVAGTVKLAIRPKGKAKRKLARAGKLTVNVAVTYRPSGGDPATKTKKIRLRRSRQR